MAGSRLSIVDDDALMRGMASCTLRHAGFSVSEADGGAQALALFEIAPFDLLLMDVMMPDMDGYQLCAHIRRLPEGARVPILMLTGLNDTSSIDLAYKAGATDFISKPINWTSLSHRVRYSLRSSRAVEWAMRSRDRLERAQHIANMGSWEIGDGGQSFVSSPELARLFGASSESMARASPTIFLERIAESDRPIVQAMREAAERLLASVRSSDLAFAARMASESVIARVGVNAFTLLLVDVGDEQQAGAVADRLLQSVSMPLGTTSGELC